MFQTPEPKTRTKILLFQLLRQKSTKKLVLQQKTHIFLQVFRLTTHNTFSLRDFFFYPAYFFYRDFLSKMTEWKLFSFVPGRNSLSLLYLFPWNIWELFSFTNTTVFLFSVLEPENIILILRTVTIISIIITTTTTPSISFLPFVLSI